MKLRRQVVLRGIVSGVALALLMAGVLMLGVKKGSALQIDGPRLISALQSYVHDLRSSGQPIPASIHLSRLIEAGYLNTETAQILGTAEVEFYPGADETRPQSILVSALLPDGTAIVVLGDGSVQQLTRRRLIELQGRIGQPTAPSNRRSAPASRVDPEDGGR